MCGFIIFFIILINSNYFSLLDGFDLGQKNVIKITHTYNGDRWSQTTFGPDVSKDHPGHPTGTSYYYYRFEGLDAAKSRNSFVMALQSEIKANITGTRDR